MSCTTGLATLDRYFPMWMIKEELCSAVHPAKKDEVAYFVQACKSATRQKTFEAFEADFCKAASPSVKAVAEGLSQSRFWYRVS